MTYKNLAKQKQTSAKYYRENKDKIQDKRRAKRNTLKPLVYAWFTPEGACAYVGRGTKERSKEHRRTNWWTPIYTLITMTCDSEWQAMEYEGIWGARYQPKYNKDGYRHSGQ